MKKIEVITFHKVYNYGAALQAYATVKFLEQCGFEAEIIDYYANNLKGYGTFKNAMREVANEKHNVLIKIIYSMIKLPSYKRLKKRFDYFVEKNLPITKPYYSGKELEEDLPIADAYCTGSDQVWNNYYTRIFEGAYFLEFVPDKYPCFSIASSFGKKEFNEKDQRYIKEHLRKYQYISVREKTGIEILNKIGIKNASIMLDPTLLVPIELWKDFASNIKVKEPYILVYQLHGDSNAMNAAVEFGKRKGMKVLRLVTMYHQVRPGCKNIIVPDVDEWVAYFKNAAYVFTDSFHGTVFSIMFKRRVGVTVPMLAGNRITDLLTMIGAEKIVLNNMDEWENYINEESFSLIHEKLSRMQKEKVSELKNYLDTI